MIIRGSLNYDVYGRPKRNYRTVKPVYKVSSPLRVRPTWRGEEKNIPSAPITPYVERKDDSYKKEISANYTIAIPYNKGGYQVISKENIKDIGK